MKTRALTASEAVARLVEIGYVVGSNCIKDNAFTLPFGETTFRYVNPRPNMFNPSILAWDSTGVRYAVRVYEDCKGNSNIFLYRYEGDCGMPIADYNKMKAAEKKEFMAMLESAERYELQQPQDIKEA